MGTNTKFKSAFALSAALTAAMTAGCTQQLSNSFRLQQQEETFAASSSVNTKLDMLWVIDNSASMDVTQRRLRDGITAFANRYMKPTWDIRIAVITSDTYIGNAGFSGWIGSTYAGSAGWKSEYIAGNAIFGEPGRATPFANPAWAPGLFELNPISPDFGKAMAGLKVQDLWPYYNRNWSTLQAGNHDGPMTTLCMEYNRLFWQGLSHCTVRDNQIATGVDECVSPGGGQSSVTQCVNTSMSDNVHSGKSVISTMPPSGTSADAAWTNQLVKDFMVNLSVGSSGNGSERPLSSMLQLVNDNEGGPNAFFRAGSLRAIVLVSDEDDQSMAIPGAGANPGTGYTAVCAPKTVDGHTYTIGRCPNVPLLDVNDVKDDMDAFFRGLDGVGPTDDPNYFVVSIVAESGASINTLQTERCTEEDNIFGMGACVVATDRADRLIDFANAVGNGSMVMDLGEADYTPMLDAIGTEIAEKKAVFILDRAPTTAQEMLVYVKHADGSRDLVPSSKWTIVDRTLTITDLDFVLSLASTDEFIINYQPRSVQ